MHLVGFLFLCFALGEAKEIGFEPCEGIAGVPTSVEATPCTKEPCEVQRGESVAITVKCVSNVNADKLRLSIFAEVAEVELPYPGMKRDACHGKNLTCPITVGQEITYVQKIPVKEFFPLIEAKARLTLATNDEQDKNVCCFKAPVKVVERIE